MKAISTVKFLCTIAALLLFAIDTLAQTGVSINTTGTAPDAQAILDISSTTKGALLPRMTTAQATTLAGSLNAGDDGMIIYDTDAKSYKYWDGGVLAWQVIPNVANTGNTLDAAYDEGGAGSGRVITADNGAVDIQGTGGLLVTGNTGIGTATPDYELDVAGDIGTDNRLYHNDDSNTFIEFTPDRIQLHAGNASDSYVDIQNSAAEMAINEGGVNRDFRVEGGTEVNLLFVDGSADQVGIATSAPTTALDVNGQIRMRTGAALGYVPVGDANGVMTWTDPATLGADITTASNGLYESTDDVRLGGDLTEATEIQLEAFNLTLDINGTGEFVIQDANVDHFKVDAAGDAYFGSDTYFKDTNTGGTDLVKISDAGVGGNDGRIEVFANGTMNHVIHGDGNTIFNDQNLDRDFIVHPSGANNALYVDASTARIGINTGSPAQQLHVVGNARVSGLADAAGAVVLSDVAGDLGKVSLTGSTADVLLGNGTFGPGSAFADHDWYQALSTSTPTAIGDWIYTDGHVGIGTGAGTNPSAPLHVVASGAGNPDANSILANNPNNSAGQDAIVTARVAGSSAGDPFFSMDINGEAGWSIGMDNSHDNRLKIAPSWSNLSAGTAMVITTDGNVGIGTTDPDAHLNVGNASGGNILITREGSPTTGQTLGSLYFDAQATSVSTTDAAAVIRGLAAENMGNSNKGGHLTFLTKANGSGLATAATERMRITQDGNVGIGNAAPAYKAHIGAGANDGVMIGNYNDQLGWNGTGTAPQLSMRFAGYRDVVGNFTGAKISGVRTNICCSGLSQGMELAFYTQEATATGSADANLTERLRIGNGGNIGIGTSTPAEKLHVVGNARISGLSAGGNVQSDGSGNLIISNDLPGSDSDYIWNQNGSDQGANFRISGTGQMSQTIATASGNWYMRGGDDHELRDINVANYIGIWGRQNSDRAGLQLGSDNSYIFGDNGNIGVGTTTPAQKLDVGGAIRSTGNYYINNTSPTVYFQDSDNETGMIHMNSNLLYFLSGSGNNSVTWTTNGSLWPLTINMLDDVSTFGGEVNFMEGSVGINTTTPSGLFHVNNADDSYMYYSTTGNLYLQSPESSTAQVRIGAAWDRPGVYSNQQLELFSDATGIIFGDSNVERMRMTAAGNLGIGNTGPAYKLHTSGDIYADGGWFRVSGNQGLYFQSHGTGIHSVEADGGTYGSVNTYGNEGGWEGYSIDGRYVLMAQDNGQDVGLYNDVDNYWYFLINRLATDNGYRFFNSYTGNLNMRIQHTNGGNYASYDGDNNWDFYSDKRLKKNIETEENILDRLLKLDVVNYDFIERERTKTEIEKGTVLPSRTDKEIGFIAQEVEKYFPSLVSESEDDRYDFSVKALGYSSFGVLAIGGIKELKAEKDEEIAELKNKIDSLLVGSSENEEVQKLKAEVEELKNLVNELLKNQK